MLTRYIFWLAAASLFVFTLERFAPWRPQKAIRKQFGQDVFWLIFNGYALSILLAWPSEWIAGGLDSICTALSIPRPGALRLLSKTPLWIQFSVLFLFKDFIEWCVHICLHRFGFLWKFHRLHHSIVEMDWMGNMRFHWMEIIIYKSIKYLPLAVLGIHWKVVLAIAIVSTLIGHLNHANLNLGWGMLGYIFNSPRFHIWHHDIVNHGRFGQNFAITLSVWDWIFGTARVPKGEQPMQLGFKGIEYFPASLWKRFAYPLFKK